MKKVILSVFALCALNANNADFSKAQELVAKKDYEGACELFTKICHDGSYEGCQEAIYPCKMESGGNLDHPGLDILFMGIACDKGHIKGCMEVVDMSLVGNYAVGYDVEGAKKALSKACELKDASSCAYLADIYAGSDSFLNDISEDEPRLEDYKTQIDKNKAMEYYKKACELGLESACGRFENMRSQDLQDDYLKKALALLEKNKASQLEKSQNAYKEWLRLDEEFLGSLRNSIGDAVLNEDFIYSHILEQSAKRTALLCRGSKGKDCAGLESKGANRPNRDKIARDDRGYSSKFNKAIKASGGNTAKILETNEAEVAIQDKWLNESYKKLRAKLSEEQKEQLKKAQRAWLKYRGLDGDFIYDAQGGSVAKMDASAEFLGKLAARVVFFEKLLEKLGMELEAKEDYEGACEIYTVSCFENGNFEGCQKAVSACKISSGAILNGLDNLGFDINFMDTACDNGIIEACHEVVDMSLVGNYAIGYDVEGAKKALSKACGFGNANSCANLADIYAGNDEYLNDLSENEPDRLSGYKIDKNKAMEYYKKACDLGEKRACERL